VQPIVLSPLPEKAVQDALQGAEKLIAVEENSDGQLAMLLARHGIVVDNQIHRYDGRPFALEELEARVKEVLA